MEWHANVLVIANVTATSSLLAAALRDRAAKGPIGITLLMPAAQTGLSGRAASRPDLDAALAHWREAGIEAEGMVGDHDPIEAIHDVWDPARFDEVIVSTLPGQTSRWLRTDLPHRVAAFTGVPVTHVVAMDMRREPAHGPLPEAERSPLGPLSVLSWGGGSSRARRA